mmetsp:Transcript_12412/g.29491  ORF Transcript_12412/g.29491 Transcript_12412/m.29491 type:complete len:212 (-) Transcript_12412:444-1079(-)
MVCRCGRPTGYGLVSLANRSAEGCFLFANCRLECCPEQLRFDLGSLSRRVAKRVTSTSFLGLIRYRFSTKTPNPSTIFVSFTNNRNNTFGVQAKPVCLIEKDQHTTRRKCNGIKSPNQTSHMISYFVICLWREQLHRILNTSKSNHDQTEFLGLCGRHKRLRMKPAWVLNCSSYVLRHQSGRRLFVFLLPRRDKLLPAEPVCHALQMALLQ